MSNKVKYLMLLLAFSSFPFSDALATKCFKRTDLKGFKEIFPIVVKGKIVERTEINNQKNSFLLKIQILEVAKGKFNDSYVTAEENHSDRSVLGKHSYTIGDEYYFPIAKKPQDKENSVYLPADGCPGLPK